MSGVYGSRGMRVCVEVSLFVFRGTLKYKKTSDEERGKVGLNTFANSPLQDSFSTYASPSWYILGWVHSSIFVDCTGAGRWKIPTPMATAKHLKRLFMLPLLSPLYLGVSLLFLTSRYPARCVADLLWCEWFSNPLHRKSNQVDPTGWTIPTIFGLLHNWLTNPNPFNSVSPPLVPACNLHRWCKQTTP